MTKFLFITGGVVSSLGKGITSASIGRLLKDRGLNIRMLKIDPYLNVDPGTMNPYQHGEVFVTEDGAETDLDLGHYERFTGDPTSRECNVTAGRIYWEVLHKERRGDYLGGTVQMIPHISDHIKNAIRSLNRPDVDVAICEIGGTVGDIEGLIFLEAIRQIGLEEGRDNVMYIHLTYVPYIRAAGEIKTKPTQQSVAKLREIGILPDILICRTDKAISEDIRHKLSMFCNVPLNAVLQEPDVEHSIYEVPLTLLDQGIDELILVHFRMAKPAAKIQPWKNMVEVIRQPKRKVRIGVVGKYSELQDAYKSIYEAIIHGGIPHQTHVDIVKIAAETLEQGTAGLEALRTVDGILVPGGFGQRGIEGKIVAIRYAREHNIPFLGICLGMQCAVIEFARNVCGMAGAHSVEMVEDTQFPVISLMEEQKKIKNLGGTMRLGAWPCRLKPGTKSAAAYGTADISERHRHRFEMNNDFRSMLESKGMVVAGVNPDTDLVEIVELTGHRWFVATQFHPEFKSQPLKPHPLYRAFVGAALAKGH